MINVKLESYKITNSFNNGFDIDFTLQGSMKVFNGRMYKNIGSEGYCLGVFMNDEFFKFSREPFSRQTQLIANQVLKRLKGK